MTRILAVLLAIGATLSAAELKVLTIGAINPGFRTIADQYGRETGNTVTMQADTAPGLSRRIAAGEAADLLIAPGNVIDEAAKQGKAIASTKTAVARVGIGVEVRAGASVPNVASVDALREALLNADFIIYNQGSSGLYMEKLFEQMGIAARIQAKTVRFANAAQVADRVMADTGNEIGFGPLPEILSSDPKRLHLAGPLPSSIQHYTDYDGAVMSSGHSDLAQRFLRDLTSPAARQMFAAAGVD